MALVYRSLRADRSRTLLSVLAVAAAITLVIVLEGFKAGVYEQVRTYRERLPAPLVALPAGAATITFARAGIPQEVQESLARVSGVEAVRPLVSAPLIFVSGDQRSPITLVGYESAGGPWRLSAGRGVATSGEAVMDRALAKRFGLGLEDSIELFDRPFRIVGLSDGTASMLGSYVFIALQDAHEAVHPVQSSPGAEGGAASFVLLSLAPGADAAQMRRTIEAAVPQVKLVTPRELAASDVALMEGILGSTINVLVVTSYVAGVLVISLTLYSAVLEHLREFGVMKAVGSSNGLLYRYVLGQVTVLALAGFGVALLASLGVARLVAEVVPQYQILPWQGEVMLRAAVATAVMAAVASLIPVRQVASVEPAVVFR
jgi:putative ABC transport system permease protein